MRNTRQPENMKTSIEKAAGKASLPFKIIEQLGIACGYERSFKMLENKLLANRFLLGIETADLKPEQLLDICHQLDMPTTYMEAFKAHVPDANLVFLGFEDNEADCVYKIYLEFWEKVTKDIQIKSNRNEPALLHLGFKWNTDNNTEGTISRYTCYPLLSINDILKRLSGLYESREEKISLEVAEDIIKFAASKSVATSFIYVEVSEENNPRRSFDINLYKANLRLSDIYPSLSRTRQHYSIPAEQFARLYKLVDNKLFGHLSGGVNRKGNDFLTVYYEV